LLLYKVDPSSHSLFYVWGRQVWTGIGAFGAAAIVLAILVMGHAERDSEIQAELASERAEVQSALSSPHEEKVDPCFGAPAMINPHCALRNSGVPLQPSLDNFSTDRPREWNRCYTPKDEKLRTCNFGYEGSDAKKIAIVGDSKGIFLLPALRKVLNANKWKLTTYLGKTCALMIPPKDECRGPMEEAERELLQHPYDLVIMANVSYGVEQQAIRHRAAMEPITAAGSRILVVADNPVSSEEAIACLTRVSVGDRTSECGTPRGDAFPKPDALVESAHLVAGTTVMDLTPYYCNADRCPSVIGDVIVHSDATHITATLSRTLWQPIEEGVRRALDTPVTTHR
jgi:hypothetical protein